MREKLNNYGVEMENYVSKNGLIILLSLIPIVAYSLVISGFMFTGFIPIYSWDMNMPFWKKCLWELIINVPLAAWMVSWVLSFIIQRKVK